MKRFLCVGGGGIGEERIEAIERAGEVSEREKGGGRGCVSE